MYKNPHRGKFIVFEGLDGSGQTTQTNLLRDFFISKGQEVVLTKEPTLDSAAGKKIRAVLNKKIKLDSKSLQELFAEDRLEHLENVINPALKDGKTVISDRYFFSSFAYGTAAGADLEWLIKVNNDFLLPDLTIILKVRPEICLERIEKRGEEKTLFEKAERLSKVWKIYEVLPNHFENVFIVDGERSVDAIAKDIVRVLEKKLR